MTNEYFNRIRTVGRVRSALNDMGSLLGVEHLTVTIQTDEKLTEWEQLENEYDLFYSLPLEERLIKSGAKAPDEVAS